MTEQDRANLLLYCFNEAAEDLETLQPTDYQVKQFIEWSGAAEKSTMTAVFKFFVIGMNFALTNYSNT